MTFEWPMSMWTVLVVKANGNGVISPHHVATSAIIHWSVNSRHAPCLHVPAH
jgi:hypothetical protein